MSNRLKRKLGDLGVDTHSAKANENFVLIGTPLPSLDKSKDLNEFVPLWKQEVRDEKGRRRLHGAFTGGFSAGYYNTVGSKEGWTPSTFVSSRNDRANKPRVRPEDFMDEEDLQDLQDSRKLVDKTDEMDLSGAAPQANEEDDTLAKTLEKSMVPAPKDSAGAQILKKMGWKMGQGIGPRISLRQRRLQDLQATTGKLLSIDDVKLSEEDGEADKHTYARRDTPLLIVPRKDNSWGLGYSPGMSLNERLGVKGGGERGGPNISAGFGLGALNEADEDDLDVYDGGLGSSGRNKTAFDVEDQHEDRGRSARTTGAVKGEKQMFRSGLPVLSDFVLSDKPVSEERWFPLPPIPKGWTPDPRRVWSQDPNFQLSKNKENEPISNAKWKQGISANERGSILGETPLPSAPRSVFEYISQKDKERLQNFSASRATLEQPQNEDFSSLSLPTPSVGISVPRTEPHVAAAALKGFQPFTSDRIKQARYTVYLHSQADPSLQPPGRSTGQSVESYNKEMVEFAKSAVVFKPMSGAMAGRFATAKVIDKANDMREGLFTPATEGDYSGGAEGNEREDDEKAEEREDPKMGAVRMGMYGDFTREVSKWMPDRLLCKRFGVKEPEVLDGAADAYAGMAKKDEEEEDKEEEAFAEEAVGPSRPRDLSNIGLGEDVYQGRDTLSYKRPPMDVFKAIFASDEEDSEDEGGEEEKMDVDQDEVLPAPQSSTTTEVASATENEPAVEPVEVKAKPVDLSLFKPTFIPRKNAPDEGGRKDKKDKKSKKSKANVSFAMDEGEDGGLSIAPERPKKKKRKDKEKKRVKAEEKDEEMWVEKEVPDVVKALPAHPVVSHLRDEVREVDGVVLKGRKRAADFLD